MYGHFSSGTGVANIFPQLKDLQLHPAPINSLHIGDQNFGHCCLVPVNQSLAICQDGNLTRIGKPSFIVDDIETFQRSQFPCTASCKNDLNGTPIVKFPYKWCLDTCPGWQRSRTSDLKQRVNPLAGFIVPAVVFCLSVPRQRNIIIPEALFDNFSHNFMCSIYCSYRWSHRYCRQHDMANGHLRSREANPSQRNLRLSLIIGS